MFDLSMVAMLRSSSASDCGSMELANALTTTIRLAVGLMSCSSSKVTHDFSSMGAKVRKNERKGKKEKVKNESFALF